MVHVKIIDNLYHYCTLSGAYFKEMWLLEDNIILVISSNVTNATFHYSFGTLYFNGGRSFQSMYFCFCIYVLFVTVLGSIILFTKFDIMRHKIQGAVTRTEIGNVCSLISYPHF